MENQPISIIPQEKGYSSLIDRGLAYKSVSIHDVRTIAILKFGSYKNIGLAFGVGQRRAWHILNGFYPPKNPDIIRRIADALDINAIILTKIFDNIEGRERLSKPKQDGQNGI